MDLAEHVGTLKKARSGLWYVECACYWKSNRALNLPELCWEQHEKHLRIQAQIEENRRRIHGR